MFKDFVLRKQDLPFRKSCFIFAAVTIFVYRLPSVLILYRYGLYRPSPNFYT